MLTFYLQLFYNKTVSVHLVDLQTLSFSQSEKKYNASKFSKSSFLTFLYHIQVWDENNIFQIYIKNREKNNYFWYSVRFLMCIVLRMFCVSGWDYFIVKHVASARIYLSATVPPQSFCLVQHTKIQPAMRIFKTLSGRKKSQRDQYAQSWWLYVSITIGHFQRLPS